MPRHNMQVAPLRFLLVNKNMAYLRTKEVIKGEGLDVFIEGMMKMFSNQIAIRNSEDEANFNRLILENHVSLDSQLDYRKEQLKRVADDPTERKRIRAEISNLKSQVDNKKFTDEYTQKLIDYGSGIESIDSVLTWLKGQRMSTSDPTRQSILDQAILTRETEKYNLIQKLVTDQTTYAVNDKSADIINTQIEKVSSLKNQALLAGNDALVANYNLQLQSLNRALGENTITKEIHNLAVSNMTGYSSAVSLLDAYNGKILSSSTVGSIKIGDVVYTSPKEFWTYKRDSYLADTGNDGFFSRLNTEQKDLIKTKSYQNNLTTSGVNEISSIWNNLAGRPEMAAYANQITNSRQTIIQEGVDKMSDSIINKYSIDYDINKAVNELNALKGTGGNIEGAYSKILSFGAQIKQTQVSNILSSAQGIINANPNITNEKAINQALVSGAGLVLSPTQLAGKSEAEIVKETAAGAEKQAFTPEPRTTTPITPEPPPVVPKTIAPIATPTPTPTSPMTMQMDFGMTNAQVKELQKFLNKMGYAVAAPGAAGSAGYETEYFGPATQAALKKFQAAQGIVSTGDPLTTGYGRVGPLTLAKIKELYK